MSTVSLSCDKIHHRITQSAKVFVKISKFAPKKVNEIWTIIDDSSFFVTKKKYQITLTINLTEKKYRAKKEFNTSVVTGNINQYNMHACMKTYICRYDSLKNYFLHLLLSLHAIHKFDDV